MSDAFMAIQTFVNELTAICTHRSLHLYRLLLTKTDAENPTHKEAIQIHSELFETYVKANADFILDKSSTLSQRIIRFSTRVYINLPKIYAEASDADKVVIKQHLLHLMTLLDRENREEALALMNRQVATVKSAAPFSGLNLGSLFTALAGSGSGSGGGSGSGETPDLFGMVGSLLKATSGLPTPKDDGGGGEGSSEPADPTQMSADILKILTDSGMLTKVVELVQKGMTDGSLQQTIQTIQPLLGMFGLSGENGLDMDKLMAQFANMSPPSETTNPVENPIDTTTTTLVETPVDTTLVEPPVETPADTTLVEIPVEIPVENS